MSKIKLINEIHPELVALGFKLGDIVEAAIRLDQQCANFETHSRNCSVFAPDFEIVENKSTPMKKNNPLLSDKQKAAIVESIRLSEKRTGDICGIAFGSEFPEWTSPKDMPALGERVLVKFTQTEGGYPNYEVDTVLMNPEGQRYFSMTEYENITIIGWKHTENSLIK